jgi:hypothetical protein
VTRRIRLFPSRVIFSIFSIQWSPNAKATFDAEKSHLKNLEEAFKSRPDEFAKMPRVIAWVAVCDLIDALIASPYSNSRPIISTAGHFHFADTFGWRFILKIDSGVPAVEVLHLARLLKAAIPVEETLIQMQEIRNR